MPRPLELRRPGSIPADTSRDHIPESGPVGQRGCGLEWPRPLSVVAGEVVEGGTSDSLQTHSTTPNSLFFSLLPWSGGENRQYQLIWLYSHFQMHSSKNVKTWSSLC